MKENNSLVIGILRLKKVILLRNENETITSKLKYCKSNSMKHLELILHLLSYFVLLWCPLSASNSPFNYCFQNTAIRANNEFIVAYYSCGKHSTSPVDFVEKFTEKEGLKLKDILRNDELSKVPKYIYILINWGEGEANLVSQQKKLQWVTAAVIRTFDSANLHVSWTFFEFLTFNTMFPKKYQVCKDESKMACNWLTI